MTDEEKYHEMIERYLMGQLNEDEIVQFQLELVRNKELQEALAQQEMIMKTLWAPKAKAITPPKRYRLLRIMFGVVIIGISLFFLFPLNKVPSAVNGTDAKDTLEKPANDVFQTNEKSRTPATVEPDDEKPSQKAKRPPYPQAHQPASENKAKDQPVLADNFRPNPEWENYIGSNLRSNDIQFFVEEPSIKPTTDPKAQSFLFSINGAINTRTKVMDSSYQVLFFSNKQEDFQAYKPIKRWDIKPQKKESNRFVFQLQEPLHIFPGRYYFVIENTESGIWHHVGSLEVLK